MPPAVRTIRLITAQTATGTVKTIRLAGGRRAGVRIPPAQDGRVLRLSTSCGQVDIRVRVMSAQASGRLETELAELASEAFAQSECYQGWARLWRVTDLVVGLATAVLTAIAGATGLASTAGRVPAAFMALGAAALTAAARFLRSDQRYETNRRRHIAWQVLGRDARLATATGGYPAPSLYDAVRGLLERRSAIMSMDHFPLPPEVAYKQAPRRGTPLGPGLEAHGCGLPDVADSGATHGCLDWSTFLPESFYQPLPVLFAPITNFARHGGPDAFGLSRLGDHDLSVPSQTLRTLVAQIGWTDIDLFDPAEAPPFNWIGGVHYDKGVDPGWRDAALGGGKALFLTGARLPTGPGSDPDRSAEELEDLWGAVVPVQPHG